MASITYRLRSSNHVGAIDMDGKVISCREVQMAVAEKLRAPAEEIRIFMADSTDLLHPDEELPAYAVVDVVRQAYSGKPTYAAARASKTAENAITAASASSSSVGGGGGFGAGPIVGSGTLTEEERLAQLQAEVGLDTGIDQIQSARFRRGGGPGGRGGGPGGRGGGGGPAEGGGGGGAMDAMMFRPPPRSYICHNCGKSGHYIQHCPAVKANGGKHIRVLSLPIGIPESMLVECSMDDPAPKFITRDHRIVKRKMDTTAFASVVLPSVPGSATPSPQPQTTEEMTNDHAGAEKVVKGNDRAPQESTGDAAEEQLSLPEKYLCVVDGVPAQDALRAPCCKRLVCKTCFQTVVDRALQSMDNADAEPPTCPGCDEPLMIDEFVPAVEERKEIERLLNTRKRRRS